MLKRIYLNNFRCLINFELAFSGISLLMGANGTGKSSLFDILYRLRRFILNEERVGDLFSESDVADLIGKKKERQTFEVDVEGNAGLYRYRLVLEHDLEHLRVRMDEETLTFNGHPLFSFRQGNSQLYRDNGSKGPGFPMDWSRSGVGFLQRSPDNTRLFWFRDWLHNMHVLRINPVLMGAESRREVQHPDLQLTDYASWFRYLSQEHQGKVFNLVMALREILPGFDSFSLKEAGEAKILRVGFKNAEDRIKFLKLHQLSEGQRALIALYTILHCVSDEPSTICVDEPENFLALPEVQHWLNLVQERSDLGLGQAILISHHPRIINFLARGDSGIWLERDGTEPTRMKRVTLDSENGGLTAAELVERGWIENR